MFDAEDRAREHAGRFPKLGRFIAELAIPDAIRIERTGHAAGHFTVWADSADLLAWVVRVTPVDLE